MKAPPLETALLIDDARFLLPSPLRLIGLPRAVPPPSALPACRARFPPPPGMRACRARCCNDEGARDVHGLTIDYLGIWNEKVANHDYIKARRSSSALLLTPAFRLRGGVQI